MRNRVQREGGRQGKQEGEREGVAHRWGTWQKAMRGAVTYLNFPSI